MAYRVRARGGRTTEPVRSGQGVGRPVRRALPLVALLLMTMLAPAASAQVSAVSLTTSIGGPSSVAVGDIGVPGSITITNNSTNVGPVLFSVDYHPSCTDLNLACPAPERGPMSLSPTATATCHPQPLTVVGLDQGRYQFVPQSSLFLAPPGMPGNSCTIDFTFNVFRMPATDALPATPGTQTVRSAIVRGSAETSDGATVYPESRAVASITVSRAQSSIVTRLQLPSSTATTLGRQVAP